MEAFTRLSGMAVPILIDNLDTDMIIPKQFLKTIKSTGLAKGLLYELRFDEGGNEKPDFILNTEPWRRAKILIAGENFGCGSLCEHAQWALLDYGIKCIIAESFAENFYNNCFKNGILPITLPKGQVAAIATCAKSKEIFTVDLNNKVIMAGEIFTLPFMLEKKLQQYLLEEKSMDKITQKEKYP